MILYGSSLSPFVRKVLAYAAEKGIDLDVQRVGPGDPNPDFRAASPFGKMPALRDGGYRLADSSAIVHYLEAKYPEPALIPADAELRGKTIWFEEFADTILTSCGAKMFFNRIVAPRFIGRPGDLAAADRAETEELPPILDYLERTVPDPGGYLVGNTSPWPTLRWRARSPTLRTSVAKSAPNGTGESAPMSDRSCRG